MATSSIVRPQRESRDSVVIRFAGDSGDGMQVTGSQFTLETALAGSDFSTFPDFPAEIRAPTGTTFGVSAFQIHFGSSDVMTPGDAVDVLVAMNPAALTVELRDLKIGGTVIVDTAAFNERNLSKAAYARNPLDDDSLAKYQVLRFDITKLTADAVKPHGLSSREAHLCRNMWALGLLLWLDTSSPEPSRSRDATARSAGRKAWRGDSWPGCGPPASRRWCSPVIRSPRPRRCCTRWRISAPMASSRSRPRTRSPRAAPRWAPRMPAPSA